MGPSTELIMSFLYIPFTHALSTWSPDNLSKPVILLWPYIWLYLTSWARWHKLERYKYFPSDHDDLPCIHCGMKLFSQVPDVWTRVGTRQIDLMKNFDVDKAILYEDDIKRVIINDSCQTTHNDLYFVFQNELKWDFQNYSRFAALCNFNFPHSCKWLTAKVGGVSNNKAVTLMKHFYLISLPPSQSWFSHPPPTITKYWCPTLYMIGLMVIGQIYDSTVHLCVLRIIIHFIRK